MSSTPSTLLVLLLGLLSGCATAVCSPTRPAPPPCPQQQRADADGAPSPPVAGTRQKPLFPGERP